jgi:hypothetical protein
MIVEKVAKIEQHTGKGILLSKRPDVTEADLFYLAVEAIHERPRLRKHAM